MSSSLAAQRPAPVAPKAIAVLSTPEEALALIGRLRDTITDLYKVIAEETALVRDARIGPAAPIAEKKSELSRRYVAELDCLKANAAFVRDAAADEIEALKVDNDDLQKALEVNLAVLATAHAVAEGVIRQVAAAVEAKRTAAGYGADGKTPGRSSGTGAPLALSREL